MPFGSQCDFTPIQTRCMQLFCPPWTEQLSLSLALLFILKSQFNEPFQHKQLSHFENMHLIKAVSFTTTLVRRTISTYFAHDHI